MITFQELRLKNHVVFRDLAWEMSAAPLSVIRGRNYDRRSHSANAVGKSLLGATIANLITESPPIAVRKRAAKDLVYGKSRVEFDVRNDKTDWTLCQFAKGKSVHYDIIKNGKSLQAKKIDTARKFIQQAVPFSEDHLYSQVFVSSYRPSVLLIGSASQRMNYFESVFDMRIYDLMRKSLLRELQGVNEKFSQQQLLQKQREQLTPKLGEDLAPRIKKIRQRFKELLATSGQTNEQIQQLTAYITLAEQINDSGTVEELQRKQKNNAAKLRVFKKRYQRLQRKMGAARSNDKIQRARKQILRELAKLPDKIDPGKLANELTALTEKTDKLTKRVTDYLDYEDYIGKYHSIIKQVDQGIELIAPDKLEKQLTEISYNLRQRKQLRGGKPCPLCGQTVNQREHKHTLQQWSKKVGRLRKRIISAKRLAFCRKIEAKLSTKILNLPINRAQRQLDNYRKQQKTLQQRQKAQQQRQELQQQLAKLPAVKPIKINNRQYRQMENQINKLQEANNRIVNDIKLLDKLSSLELPYENLPQAHRALRGLQVTVAEISPKLRRISDRMHRFTAMHSEHRAAQQQLGEIERELNEIDKSVENRDVLEALAKAYSAKGIRVMQVSALAAAYTNALNTMASTIYSEKYNFHTEVTNTSFNILAERHGKISDVRALSGSEGRQFLTISAPALISLMPDSLRCSHLILDEVETGIDPNDLYLFTHEFLPILTASVPNVVLLTPQSRKIMPIPNAKELMLVRRNGYSQWG